MQLQITAVGKVRESYLTQGIAEYMKRMTPYAKLSIVEVPDEKAPETLSAAEELQVKQKEGERLLARIKPDMYVVALAIDGALWSSDELSRHLQELGTYGRSQVAFVVGGSLGLSDEVLQRADQRLSLGRLTLAHQLVRLVLVEQVYRSFKIMRGEPYHK